MVGRALHVVHKEIRGLHQAAYILAIFTFVSQLLALVRDRLLAGEFGAHLELDLYYTAFRIPDALYVIFASTLSVYVLIPFLAKRTQGEDGNTSSYVLSQFFSLFVIVYFVIALLACIFTREIVIFLFPGFSTHVETLVPLVRVLLLQPLLLGVSSLFGVVTQMEHRFVLYALSPLLYNFGIIVGLLFFYPRFGLLGLTYGVVMGALFHVLIQIPSVMQSSFAPHFMMRFEWKLILEVCRTSFVRALTLSLHQFVLLGFIAVASFMTVGSVSIFQFAYNLQSVPLAIIGVSYSVAVFPLLAEFYAHRKYVLFGAYIEDALRHIIFWSLPVIALFVVIRAQFVRVVLGSGAFDWNDTRLTAAVLAIFICSLTAQALHLLIVRALYARGNTRLPFFVTLFSSFLALLLSYVFYTFFIAHGAWNSFFESFMRLQGVSGIEVLALPLGYSCALILHSIILFTLGQKYLYIGPQSLLRPLVTGALSSCIAGYVAYTTLNILAPHLILVTVWAVLLEGALAGICGLIAYSASQYLMGSNELSEVTQTFRRRFRKGSIVVPQDEDTLAV